MSMLASPKFILRKALARLMAWRARMRSVPIEPHPDDWVTLVVAPHQDDCALGCGGLIAMRAAAGQKVFIAYLTDGSASHPGHPTITPRVLAAMRADEARNAALALGVDPRNVTFFGAPDGELPRLSAAARGELVRKVADLVDRIGASELLVTSKEDGSSEHTAANAIVREAVAATATGVHRILEYPIWSNWSPLRLGPQITAAKRIHRLVLGEGERRRKAEALRAFRSQFEPSQPWSDPVIPRGFLCFFQDPEEFYFEHEMNLPGPIT